MQHLWLSSYKFSNVFVAIQHPWNGLFCGVSRPFLLQIWLKFAEISIRGTSLIRQIQLPNNLSKLSVSAETRHTQSWWFWSILRPNLPSENPKYCQKHIAVVSFISAAFVVVNLKIWKCLRDDAASMNWPLLRSFWALSPANMSRICWNFDLRYVFHKTKTVSKQSFKIKCLSGNKTYPKLMVLVHFRAHFPPENPKYCQKPNFFPETASLWLSNNTSPRSQINHRILIKLIKKTHFFWPNMDFLR